MQSFNLQNWTRIGTMKRAHCTSLWSAPAERSDDGALMWSEERRQFESGVALRLPPHSKTLSACRRFVESFLSLLRMHRDHELISLGGRDSSSPDIHRAQRFQGSTESRRTLWFMEVSTNL
jgi:hypothetical protein